MAVQPDDAEFKSLLDEASQKKAKDELHELNDKDRVLAVQSFRQWINEQDWLTTPTDFKFLLRFIRVRKYSQLLARESLENYWTVRSKFPQWFENVDPKDKVLQEIMRAGFYVVARDPDKDGCRILIENFGHLDIQKAKKDWGIDNVFKTLMLIIDWVACDENAQVNGLKFLSDMSDVTMQQVMTFSKDQDQSMKYFTALLLIFDWVVCNEKAQVSGLKFLSDMLDVTMQQVITFSKDQDQAMRYFTKALPARMKGFYVYNEPTFFDVIYAMFAPLMPQKMKDRMYLLGKNMVKVYDRIPMNLLPEAYLPDDYTGPSQGTSKQLIEDMIEDMCKPEFRNFIVDLSTPGKYGVPKDYKKQVDKSAPVASFRKLNVD